jgi:hypothetical protein
VESADRGRFLERRPPVGALERGYGCCVDSTTPDPLALRRGVLAASVLHDIPVEPADEGVRVGASWDDRDAWTPVTWPELAAALGGADPESTTGHLRLRDWLRARAWAQSTGGQGNRLVALALPVGHALHPGESWVVERVLGGVLEIGPGLRSTDGGLAAPLPPSAVSPGQLRLTERWPVLCAQVAALATLAVARLDRGSSAVLRPLGGCDVLTLLSSRRMRGALATGDGTGLRAVAVPMRSRGWFDLARIDPAFVGAAATATAPDERGITSPLLVTVDEVTVVRRPADPARLARACLS